MSWLSAAAFSSSPFSRSLHTLLPPLLTLTALHPPEEKYSHEVRIIPVDFSEGPELYPRIAKELQDLDIGVLGKVPSFT